MQSTIYTLTIYRDSKRSFTNIYDLVNYEDLESAVKYANEAAAAYNQPYKIEESVTDYIHDFNPAENDNTIEDGITYWVNAECANCWKYYWPLKTLGEAKARVKKCLSKEVCNGISIEKHFNRVVKEG